MNKTIKKIIGLHVGDKVRFKPGAGITYFPGYLMIDTDVDHWVVEKLSANTKETLVSARFAYPGGAEMASWVWTKDLEAIV